MRNIFQKFQIILTKMTRKYGQAKKLYALLLKHVVSVNKPSNTTNKSYSFSFTSIIQRLQIKLFMLYLVYKVYKV